MKRDHLDSLRDIRASAESALRFTEGMTYGEFAADEKNQFAVIRAFEVMGEAAGKVPPELRQRFPNIPWPAMATIVNAGHFLVPLLLYHSF